MNACTYTVCYNSEHCTLFEFMCDWYMFTRSVHIYSVTLKKLPDEYHGGFYCIPLVSIQNHII